MLTEDALEDVKWWATNDNAVTNFIYPPPVTITLYADASLEGWGGTDTTSEIGGRWSDHEMPAHIMYLNSWQQNLYYSPSPKLCQIAI